MTIKNMINSNHKLKATYLRCNFRFMKLRNFYHIRLSGNVGIVNKESLSIISIISKKPFTGFVISYKLLFKDSY